MTCSQLPELCGGCGEGLLLDGLICRRVIPCSEGGADIDRDDVPDSCDSCPYIFNPDQTPDPCAPEEGVCPGVVKEAILWSVTSAERVDRKPCPSPLTGQLFVYFPALIIHMEDHSQLHPITVSPPCAPPAHTYTGFSSRLCDVSGSWEPVDMISCLSVEGQSLLQLVEALEAGQLLSPAELRGVASDLAVSSSHDTPPRVGGDVRVTGKLLTQLIVQVDSLMSEEGVEFGEAITSVSRVASNLLNPDLAVAWMGVVEGVEFGSDELLFGLEAFARTSTRYLSARADGSPKELTQQYYHLVTLSSNESHYPFMITFNDSTATISLGMGTPLSSVTLGLFPTLGDLLPLRGSFNVSDMVVATPILSVQAADLEGSDVNTVSVNMTLQYARRPNLVEGATCVSWGR